jgi:hypothetical protein
MLFGTDQREQDVEPVVVKRDKANEIVFSHYPYIYIYASIYIVVKARPAQPAMMLPNRIHLGGLSPMYRLRSHPSGSPSRVIRQGDAERAKIGVWPLALSEAVH